MKPDNDTCGWGRVVPGAVRPAEGNAPGNTIGWSVCTLHQQACSQRRRDVDENVPRGIHCGGSLRVRHLEGGEAKPRDCVALRSHRWILKTRGCVVYGVGKGMDFKEDERVREGRHRPVVSTGWKEKKKKTRKNENLFTSRDLFVRGFFHRIIVVSIQNLDCWFKANPKSNMVAEGFPCLLSPSPPSPTLPPSHVHILFLESCSFLASYLCPNMWCRLVFLGENSN